MPRKQPLTPGELEQFRDQTSSFAATARSIVAVLDERYPKSDPSPKQAESVARELGVLCKHLGARNDTADSRHLDRGDSDRNGLTWTEHRKWGSELRVVADNLTTVSVRLSNTHAKTHPVCRAANRALSALSKLRSTLDDRLFKEHGSRPDQELLNTYFGSAGRRDDNTSGYTGPTRMSF